MTVSVQTPINSYTYAGSSTFPYQFEILQATDLLLTVDGAVKVLNVDYTLTGVGVQAGGSATYLGSLTAGQLVSLSRQTTLSRSNDYQDEGDFLADTFNADFDRLWMALQERATNDARSVRVPAGETLNTLPPATTRAGFLLGFDGAGGVALIAAAAQSATALALSLLSNAGSSLIGTIAAGLGAIFRTQQSKNRDFVHMRDYGAVCDGVTNDIVALQAAHDAIALAGGGMLYVAKAKLNATFNWDANKVVIEGDGGIWDFASLGAGLFAINVIQSEPDVNARPRKNMAHSFRNVLILGPTGATTVYGINIADTVSTSVCGVIFEKGGIAGFIADVTFGAGSFFTTFRDFDFGNDSAGRRSQRNWVNAASSNSGERNVFDNTRFGIVTIENFNQSNGNADTVLDHCSFNTNSLRNGTLSGGSLKIINTHVEWTGNTDVRIELIAGGNPQLIIDNPTIVPGAGQTTFGFLKVDPAIQTTCATITNPMVTSSNPITVPWEASGGRVLVANDQRYASTGYTYLPAVSQNQLAYGTFESASYTSEFTLAGTTPPARVNTLAHTGTWSLGFQGVIAQSNTATVKVPCSPGRTLNYSFWYNAVALTGTGTNFFANMSYLDVAGTVLQTIPQIFITTTTTAGWVLCTPVASLPPGPPGTVSVRIQFIIQSTTSGTPLGYVDDVVMVVQ